MMNVLMTEISFLLLKGFLIFVGTNVDDLILLILFLQTNNSKVKRRNIILSQYLCFLILIIISVLLSLTRLVLPLDRIGLLGLVPILFGVRKLLPEKVSYQADNHLNIFTMTVFSLGDGLDNISTYTILFVNESPVRICILIVCFLFLLIIWYWIGSVLARTCVVTFFTKKLKKVVPFIYILLGILILYENKTYALLSKLTLHFGD